jgi:hypothetical protein
MEEPPGYIAPRKRHRWHVLIDAGLKAGFTIAEARAFAASNLAPRRLILDGETVVGRINSLKAWGLD